MRPWWKRFRPSKSSLPAALLAAVLAGAALLALWAPTRSVQGEMDRYGTALVRTIAHASAGHLLHQDRIELAVIANEITDYPEVAGLVFYDAANEIIAMSGVSDMAKHFISPATLDDTITGYVSVVLEPPAFAPPGRGWIWLASLLAMLSAPFVAVAVLQLSPRGNSSLPIVSVPDRASAPQQSFCLSVNLHNQLALTGDQRRGAIADAMTMAHEVCAIHQGIAAEIPGRGVLLLFDRETVAAGQAVCAAFLMQRLLAEFETDGQFRCFLSETACPDSPAELEQISPEILDMDLDTHMTVAALGRPHTLLMSTRVHQALSETERTWAEPFMHPLMEDLDTMGDLYCVAGLPADQNRLVEAQSGVILGFSQAAG